MIEFRQKIFGGKARKVTKRVIDSPAAKALLVASGPAVGLANLSLNMSRKKQDTELRKEQTEAIQNLADALKESNNRKAKNTSKKAAVVFKKKHPEDINEEDCIVIPNPVSKIVKKK